MRGMSRSGDRKDWVLALQAAGSAGLLLLLFRGSGPGAGVLAMDPSGAARDGVAPPATRTFGDAGRRPAEIDPVGMRVAAIAAPPSRGVSPERGAANEPITEQEHYEAFRALAARDPAQLADLAPGVLRGEGPDCGKVALLRVLYETRSPGLGSDFALAIAELPVRSGPHGVSVPEFAVQFLGERAERAPEARSVLFESVWGAERAGSPGLRARAAAHVARTASELELHRLALVLSTEEDELVRRSVASALASNPETGTVDLLFSDLGVPRESSALGVGNGDKEEE